MTNAPASLPPGWFRARRYHVLAPLLALVVVALLQQWWVAELLEDQTVNLRFRARAHSDPPADPRLIFVGIDELSLSHFGKYPWPRNAEADFIKSIAAAGLNPHTIAFDIMFTEPSDKIVQRAPSPDQVPEQTGTSTPAPQTDDALLGEAAALLPSVITGAFCFDLPKQKELADDARKKTQEALRTPGSTLPLTEIRGDIRQLKGSDVADFPVPEIRSQSLFAFVNDNPDVDDVRHTLPLAFRVADKVYPSLALQTLCQMLNVDADKVVVDLPARVVRLTNSSGKTWTIPTNEHAEFAINYRNQDSFQYLSFFGLMQNLNNHATKGTPIAPECNVENKTLFIGESATGLGDMGPSPLSSRSPLPYVHLNVINNVLKGDYLKFVPWYWVGAGWLLVTWITLFRLKVAPLVEAVVAPIVVVILYTAAAFGIFWWWSVQIALAWPVLSYIGVNFGGVVLRWREEQKGRQQLKQLFSSMLSPEVLNHLLEHPENVRLGGDERAVTILFSDIRDYTKFSEGLSAAEVVRQLNVYFERMVGCVKTCRGTFHKYIGDAIMAAWGDIEEVSLGAEEDARNAVRSALLMRRELRNLNDERQAAGLMPLRIGIGLNHGVGVLVGLIGASSQMEFTVMGDAVNTASRLEGMTKEFKTDFAISESVRQLIGDEFLVRRLGLIVLKGKTTPTVVYEVLAEKSEILQSKLQPETVARYEEAFDHFLARRFGKAVDGFEACAHDYPDDHCVKTYLTASRDYLATPPPDDWDGRIVMTTK